MIEHKHTHIQIECGCISSLIVAVAKAINPLPVNADRITVSESDGGYWDDCMTRGPDYEAAGRTRYLFSETAERRKGHNLHDAITKL